MMRSRSQYLFLLLGFILFLSTGVAMAEYKKPSDDFLRQQLTPLQYDVTQREGTEPPFKNEYWQNKEAGIYVDRVSGEPLFSSLDKYDSGTGWPSFTKPIEENVTVETKEGILGLGRIEVKSRSAASHLGHVFSDGPPPTGLRYCMNSAALRFVPLARLEEEGYGSYRRLFEKNTVKESGSMDERTANVEVATLAGGCFWGVEELIRQLPGVVSTEVGYTGGVTERPRYEDITTGKTGHAESIRITFTPSLLSYKDLLLYFFRLHDPTTLNRQGNDRGTQYRSAIFFHNEEQQRIAAEVREEVQASGKWKDPIVTEIVPASHWYPAEEYHQDYLQKHPSGYTCHYLRE